MSDFTPDVNFLKNADGGYVKRVRTNYPIELVDAHVSHGLLEFFSVALDLPQTNVVTLRKILTSKSIDTTGAKTDLVNRILENFTPNELDSWPIERRYQLTTAGKEAVSTQEEADRNARLARASTFADLIIAKNFEEVIAATRPVGVISSSTDFYPEGISRYCADQHIQDRSFVVAMVESVIMGYYSKTVIPDMAAIGYDLSNKALDHAVAGCFSYAHALLVSAYNGKYTIRACPCCKRKDGKVFKIEEAKIGKTLPPFSNNCRADVSSTREA